MLQIICLEVAEMLSVAVNTIYKWADEGRIHYVDLGDGKKDVSGSDLRLSKS